MFSRIQQSVGVRLLMALALGLATGLGVSLLPRAQATSQVWILPGAAETAGLFGARFSSTLFLTNLAAQAPLFRSVSFPTLESPRLLP